MKLSKKLKNQIKKKMAIVLASIALILMPMAALKVHNNSISLLSKDIQGIDRTIVTVADDGAIVCDSIVQGVRDIDLPDGTYTFRVTGKTSAGSQETKDYKVELINYYDDVTYTSSVSLGDTSTEYKMLVVKYHKSLTVNSGVTVTARNVSNLTYKKGMYICVMGELINRGTITMSARGTYNCAGENVYLWKNEDSSYEYVPAAGGAGGPGVAKTKGTVGTSGKNRSTGGGGSGGSAGTNPKRGGYGSAGTSYSGGSGGGGVYHCAGQGTYAGGDAAANGGAGGYGAVRTDTSANSVYASGGAGNLAGKAAYRTSSGNSYANQANSYSGNGTGGLLTIYAETLYNKGTISSNGSNVAGKRYSKVTRYAGGGASGGGSVNLFVVNTISKGTIQANAGTSTLNTSGLTYHQTGSNGGAGTATYTTVGTAVMSLNKNQEYIGVNEKLQLNVVEDDKVTEQIGSNYAATNFVWKSTNEDVATVDANGIVTGISDGYTTVYAYHEKSRLYAMAVLNVAKNVTNPQIETGNGFTTILKSDGTVWGVGNNANGQLGDGTTETTGIPVQAHIDEDTILSNIIKISVGTDHVVALTKEGKVYAWGANTYGQLGQNNTTSTSYAKAVLGTDGQSYLTNIVDISTGAFGSVALDKNGYVYVWGNGTNGEMGNSTTTSSNLPIKTTIENAIQVSIGSGHVGALTSDGIVWAWGANTNSQLGVNSTTNISYPVRAAANVTELSLGAYHTVVKKLNETVYATGAYNYGRLGTGSTANETIFTKVNLPTTVTNEKKVKYIIMFPDDVLTDEVDEILNNNNIEKLYFDPLVTLSIENKNSSKDYITIMKENLDILKQELYIEQQ